MFLDQRDLTNTILKSYICKHILKEFEGTTYVGETTEQDSTPFLQVRYEDGDTEEFVEEDLELLAKINDKKELKELAKQAGMSTQEIKKELG